MKKGTFRLLARVGALLLGMAILGVLLRKAGWADLRSVIQAADPLLLAVAFCFFIPQVAVMAWRWQLIGGTAHGFSFVGSCRMVLSASALNVVLPSKLGDLCKGFMLSGEGGTDVPRGLGLAALDKLLDILGLAAVLFIAGAFAAKPEPWVLAFWAATGAGLLALLYLLHRARRIETTPRHKLLGALARGLNAAIEVRHHRGPWLGSLGLSLLLWGLHVGQIFVFYHGVGTAAPTAVIWSRVPIGLFVGLLPVTLAGIGTRDGAFFLLMAPWDPRPVIAWLGLFCTLRYVVMALLGVPAVMGLGSLLAASRRARDLPQPAVPQDGK
jgi:hypothetical protein